MHKTIKLDTDAREAFYDITEHVKKIVSESGIKDGLCNIYIRHTSAAICIQENFDYSVQRDILKFLKKLVPQGKWEHDAHDGNADAHIKSALIGASQSIPVKKGKLLLGRWQSVFLFEFDGPRKDREVVITLMKGNSAIF